MDVFEEEDRASGVGRVRRAECRGEHREAAADQPPGGPAGAHGFGHLVLPHIRGVRQHRPEALGGARRHAARQVVGDHRTMHGDRTRADRGVEQRGRVTVADDRLRPARQRIEVEQGQEALAPIAAARAEDGSNVRIVDHALQIGAAGLVGACQIRLAGAHRVAEHDPQPPAFEHPDTRLEPRLIDHSRGSDHTHHVAGPEPARLRDRLGPQISCG